MSRPSDRAPAASDRPPRRLPMTRWLMTQQAALERRLLELTARGVGDPVDQAPIARTHANEQVGAELGVRGSRAVLAIQGALARIALGTYETCTSCGNVIGHARLEVMPEATSCARCVARSSTRR